MKMVPPSLGKERNLAKLRVFDAFKRSFSGGSSTDYVAYHCIAFDQDITGSKERIDYVICCPHGIYAIGVKAGMVAIPAGDRYSTDASGNTTQPREDPRREVESGLQYLQKTLKGALPASTYSKLIFGYGVILPDVSSSALGVGNDCPTVATGESLSDIDKWLKNLFSYWQRKSVSGDVSIDSQALEQIGRLIAPQEERQIKRVKRRFQLPGIHELSKEQELVRAWPLEGRFFLTGGPGTGKSVMCLLRARRLHEEKKDYCFLVFNHLLRSASHQLFGIDLQAVQWQAWFYKVFEEITGRKVPYLDAAAGEKWRPVDWNACLDLVGEQSADALEEQYKDQYLIIDEGQDMPLGFYQFLNAIPFENICVAADFNQAIGHENSTFAEIRDELNPDFEHELETNYRNKYRVARLARAFLFETPGTTPPEVPRRPQKPTRQPVLFTYPKNNEGRLFRRLLLYAGRNPRFLIGVIAPNNEVRKRYLALLREAGERLNELICPISTYSTEERNELDFSEGGFIVINAQSCKGLEFDVVFVADINEFHCWRSIVAEKKMLFYVMTARAIHQVFMLRKADQECPIEVILPDDPEILERLP
jgi:DNA helicase II / ATP-dependent DNA helicase PcrA